MKNIPEKIYLQVDADGETPDEFNELAVSWCSNKVHDNDIEYLLTNAVKQEGACGKCEMLGDAAPCDECFYKILHTPTPHPQEAALPAAEGITIIHKGIDFANTLNTDSEAYKLGAGYGYSCGYTDAVNPQPTTHNPQPTDIKKITVEGILKSKLTQQAMIANNPDYTFEKVIEAMIEIAGTSFTAGYHYGIDETNPDKKEYLKSIK